MSKRNFLVIALMVVTVSLACISCASDEYTGDPQSISKGAAISFNGETGSLTRAMQGGQAAAAKLSNQFVVYGFKTTDTGKQTVFEYYNVNFADGSANSTQSNSAGWEYVGQAPNVLNTQLSSDASYTQDIKYWDFAATQYDFIAFSVGTATQVKTEGEIENGKVYVSAITPTSTPVSPDTYTGPKYTITGATTDLTKVYIADRVTAKDKVASPVANRLVAYKDAIQFAFKPLAAKVRLGLYETIPGYSVKDVKFYLAADDYSSTLREAPNLFAGSPVMPSGVGTVTLKFDATADDANRNYNKVEVASYAENLGKDVALMPLSGFVGKENLEGGRDGDGNPINPGQVFLGRVSSEATISDYQLVVPTGTGHSLTLKMDYTLLSTDISKEEITVRGATAVIPSEFTNWLPNHAYTYLFKISDNTSGWTNPDDAGHVGLYPVSFDAIVAATEEGMQQTITLMAAPSITTYAKGEKIHEDANKVNYYEKGDYNLYICLQPSTLTLNADNTKMYVATTTGSAAIVEATVADVIKTGETSGDPVNTYTKDEITVKTTGAPELTITTSPGGIPAIDAPYGTAIPGNFAVFQPTAEGTYVFEYTSPKEYYTYDEYIALTGNESVTQDQYNDLNANHKDQLLKPNKHYKVIVVKEAPVAP